MRTHHINMMRLANAQKSVVAFVGAIADLNVTAFDDTSITLDWTTPSSDNPIDYFEVWVEGVFLENTTDDSEGWSITGLTAGTSYDIKLMTVDTLGNKSGFSNEVTATTDGTDSIAESPVALWNLHTNSLDGSGNGNNGTDTGMSYVGGIANFNGGYIDVADSDDLSFTDGTDDLSFGMAFSFIWDDKTGTQFIINKRNAAGGAPREWQVATDAANLRLMFFNENDSDIIDISIPKSSITAGVENTLYFYYDGSKAHTGISAYLNGNNPIGTTSLTGTYLGQGNSNAPVRIGNGTWNTGFQFRGKMKNMYLWKDKAPITVGNLDEMHYRLLNNILL